MIEIVEVIDYTIICIHVVKYWIVIVNDNCLDGSLIVVIGCDGWCGSVVGFTFQIKITSISNKILSIFKDIALPVYYHLIYFKLNLFNIHLLISKINLHAFLSFLSLMSNCNNYL